jgi:hypothetical protein
MIVTVCLWVDQLFNSAIGDLADFTKLYKAAAFVTLAVRSVAFLLWGGHSSSLPLALSPVAHSGLVCRPQGTPSPNVFLPRSLHSLPSWLGCHVLCNHFPLDLCHLALLRCHGLGYDGLRVNLFLVLIGPHSIGRPHPLFVHPGRGLSIQLWPGLDPLS